MWVKRSWYIPLDPVVRQHWIVDMVVPYIDGGVDDDVDAQSLQQRQVSCRALGADVHMSADFTVVSGGIAGGGW